jgi:hypothetical protein
MIEERKKKMDARNLWGKKGMKMLEFIRNDI